MHAYIHSGEIGALKSLIVYQNGTLFNTASHTFDLVMRLNNDVPAAWVQAYLPDASGSAPLQSQQLFDGDILMVDPLGEGTIHFENGVKAYMLLTPRGLEVEAIGTEGVLTAFSDAQEWLLRKKQPVEGGRTGLLPANGFTPAEPASSTLRLIEDLVHSLDTGEPSRCGPRVALASTELIFAFIESHRRDGARVELPLQNRHLRMQRNHTPNQPKFQA
jgi:predicted dehydrogenase